MNMIINAIRLEIWTMIEADPEFSPGTMQKVAKLAKQALSIHAIFVKGVADAKPHMYTDIETGEPVDLPLMGAGGGLGGNDAIRQMLMMLQPVLDKMAKSYDTPVASYKPKNIFDSSEYKLTELLRLREELKRADKDVTKIDERIQKLQKIVEDTNDEAEREDEDQDTAGNIIEIKEATP